MVLTEGKSLNVSGGMDKFSWITPLMAHVGFNSPEIRRYKAYIRGDEFYYPYDSLLCLSVEEKYSSFINFFLTGCILVVFVSVAIYGGVLW